MNRRIKEAYGFEGFKALNMKKNENLSRWNHHERKHYQMLWQIKIFRFTLNTHIASR